MKPCVWALLLLAGCGRTDVVTEEVTGDIPALSAAEIDQLANQAQRGDLRSAQRLFLEFVGREHRYAEAELVAMNLAARHPCKAAEMLRELNGVYEVELREESKAILAGSRC